MENIHDIAKWFLCHESMTHKKLQKLCYYSQAWYCALYDGTPLFPEVIQAWVHGPVSPSLFASYADAKWVPIPKIDSEPPVFDSKVTDVLEAVYDAYGKYTGGQLETITHSEDPWINARSGLNPWEPGTSTITCASMREYYSRRYDQDQND